MQGLIKEVLATIPNLSLYKTVEEYRTLNNFLLCEAQEGDSVLPQLMKNCNK